MAVFSNARLNHSEIVSTMPDNNDKDLMVTQISRFASCLVGGTRSLKTNHNSLYSDSRATRAILGSLSLR